MLLAGELSALPFDSDAERDVAAAQLPAVVRDALGALDELDYSSLDWSDEEIAVLGKSLPLCPRVERLHFSANGEITCARDHTSRHCPTPR